MARIGVILCNCFGEIGKVIDLHSLKKRFENDPSVDSVTIVESLCLPGDTAKAHSLIRERGIGKVLIGACSPFGKMEFVKLCLAKEGTDVRTVRTVDLREGCAWVHGRNAEGATHKAANQLDMDLALLQNMQDSKDVTLRVQQEALVIGAGPAGLSAAAGLARLGFKTHLIDRGSAPGGLLNMVTRTYPADEPGPERIGSLIEETGKNPLIRFYAKTKVSAVKGYAGDFKVSLAGPGGNTALRVGAVVLATGARILFPQGLYGYGKIKNVITQLEMERRFATGAVSCKTAVFVQCVGARNAERPYCSTICCPLSLKNAMRIMDESPGAKAYVLHRDIMTPGSVLEAYYRKALQKGVQFIRFDADRPPEIRGQEQVSGIEVFDTIRDVEHPRGQIRVLCRGLPDPPRGDAKRRHLHLRDGPMARLVGSGHRPGRSGSHQGGLLPGAENSVGPHDEPRAGRQARPRRRRRRRLHGLRQLCRRLPLRGLPAAADAKPVREPRHQGPLQGLRRLRLRLPERGHADARAELPGHGRNDPAGLPGGALTCPPKGET